VGARERTVTRLPWLLVCLLLGCSPRRQLGVEFSGAAPNDTDVIARVTLEIFDGDECTCLDLAQSGPRCSPRARLEFTPASGETTQSGFPAGALTVRATAYDSAGMPVALRIDCWCIPDLAEQSVVFPLGSPTDPMGRGCAAM
jgi:hypothetical protein